MPETGAQETITLRPIGYIQSPHTEPDKTPIQPSFAEDTTGRAVILPEYAEGLQDIETFSHIIVLYRFHRAEPSLLRVTPYLQNQEHGVFATRHPRRPNHIGMSVLRLVKREDNELVLEGMDILDGTPILDIKPYLHRFDVRSDATNGWVAAVDEQDAQRLGRRISNEAEPK